MVDRQELYQQFIVSRIGYHAPACTGCGGLGVKTYSSTATWRGGIGGQAMTEDVCNVCWGSGNANAPWPSHRTYFAMKHRLEGLEK